jgi:hypothetical protein
MKENFEAVEKPFGSEWIFYGQDFGAKTDDLLSFEALGLRDVKVLRGVGVGASFFRDFIALNNFSADTQDYKLCLEKTKIPNSLKSVAKEILKTIPVGTPFIVRSSAIGEHGGTGIYDSDVINRSDDFKTNLHRFLHSIKLIYSGYNSPSAHIYRTKLNQQYDGMALLIQPLIGDTHNNQISPLVSGVFTEINGSPTLRIVKGYGVSSVEMDEAIVLKRDNMTEDHLEAAISLLKPGVSWDIQRDYYGKQEITSVNDDIPKLVKLVNTWKKLSANGQPYYWEFSITEKNLLPIILQVTPLNKIPINQEMPKPEGQIICDGTDVVGLGERKGRGIIWVGRHGRYGLEDTSISMLNYLNSQMSNYLLLIHDSFFSMLGGQKIKLKDFSNAAGVVELQYVREKPPINTIFSFSIDHTHNRGGTHFTELCGQVDILFLGITRHDFDEELEKYLGKPSQEINKIDFWDVPFRIVNGPNYGRVEILEKIRQTEFSKQDLETWADQFRELANMYNDVDDEFRELANSLYKFSYFLFDQAEAALINFDPFNIDRLSKQDRKKILDLLPTVWEEYKQTDDYYYYEKSLSYGETEGISVKKYIDHLKKILK